MENQVDLSEPFADNEVPPLSEEINGGDNETGTEALQEIATANPTEVDDAEQTEESTERPFIFISHRQLSGLDSNMAALVYEELSAEDYEVYLDTAQPGGTRWREAIENAIEKADFVVALVTENANHIDADWIAFELAAAHRRRQLTGKPIIIPVHLEYIEKYRTHIGAYLSGFQRIDYDGDNGKLIAKIKSAIHGTIPSELMDPAELERFLVGERRRNLMRASSLESDELDKAITLFIQDKLLWLVGDDSVRNYVALSLAVKQQDVSKGTRAEATRDRKIYEVTRSVRWSKVYNTLISDSIIIFNDASPAVLFGDDILSDEFQSLDLLNDRGNLVIVTSSPDSFLEIEQEMRKQEFRRGQTLHLRADFYNEHDKLAIFDKLLDFSNENKDIDSKQLEWARRSETRESLGSIIKKWSPADIERLVTWHLSQVKRPSDILKLLQHNADLDNEIHTWFISLDDSTRCFVMVLALFSELNREQFWGKYKDIVGKLRRLDGRLSLSPLGISRERTALYVSSEGSVDFKDERIADAINREIAKNYREYFLELLPLMEEWSVPAGRDGSRADAFSETRRREAGKSRALRDAIARMVGKMGQYGFNDLQGIVNRWASDPIIQVRDAAALALKQATVENLGTRHVFHILDEWSLDRSADEQSLFKTGAAASALGTIAAANPGRQIYKEALSRLETLARDDRRSVRFYVSIPLKRAVRKLPLTAEIENLLTLVIQDSLASTKINVAEALHEARIFDEVIGLNVLNRWLISEDPNQRWAALASVVIWFLSNKQAGPQYQDLIALLARDAETLISIFVEMVNQKYYKRRAQSVFKQLILKTPADMRRELILGMAKIPFGLLEERLLKRLRASGKPVFDALVVDVRRERWRQLLATPEAFTEDLNEELNLGHVSPEVYRALIEVLKPEPEGCRQRAAAALASSFPLSHASLDKLLSKLNRLAPSTLEPFSTEVRREAFRRLFHVPDVFIETVAEYFADNNTVTEARGAIEMLAQPEPQGYREDLMEALASGYALNRDATRRLLGQFRLSLGSTLRLLAHEFTSRLIEGALSDPAALYLNLAQATTDPYELTDVVQALKRLAVSEPWGQRKSLVRALAQTRISRTDDVDNLLQHPALQSEPELAGLRLEVRLASVLSRVFVPRFLTRFFNPR